MTLRKQCSYGKGEGLTPVEPLDLSSITTCDELLAAMSKTAFGGRALGEAAEVLMEMIRDKECRVVMTLSGAMTIAKMGLVATEMVERGWVDAIVSTGALMCHGFVETSGKSHFQYDPSMDDTELYKKGYNRVHDTLELESNLDDIEHVIRDLLTEGLIGTETRAGVEAVSSRTFTEGLGSWLDKNTEKNERALLKTCYLKKVPVYIPAFTDSELALDYAIFCRLGVEKAFDPFLDLEHYAKFAKGAKRLAIFTIGGGVPRNWAQQVACYLDILSKRVPSESAKDLRFRYGVRICPEPVHWGGLSGCTYSEGVSWGKFVPQKEGGRFAEVYADATIAWPMLVKGVIERLEKKS